MSSVKQKDPSITHLNSLGYNVIKVPRTGIAPLDLLAMDGQSKQIGGLGRMPDFWISNVPVPMPGPASQASNINRQSSNALDLGFGLDLLKSVLSVFGATSPSIDLSHTDAKSLQFNYTGVTQVSIDQATLGNYLRAGTLDVGNPALARYVNGQDGNAAKAQLFVISDVLRSTSITVTASDQKGNNVALSVPEINGIVGGKVSVKPSSASSSAITFASNEVPPVAVSFGFKAIKLTWMPTAGAAEGVGSFQFGDAGDIAFGVAPAGDEEESSGPVVFETGAASCLLDI